MCFFNFHNFDVTAPLKCLLYSMDIEDVGALFLTSCPIVPHCTSDDYQTVLYTPDQVQNVNMFLSFCRNERAALI